MDCILIAPTEVSMSNKKTFREELITRSEEFINKNPINSLYVRQFRENLGIAAIAAYLKEHGHTARVIDSSALDMSVEDIVEEVIKEKPKVVGVSILYDLYTVNACSIVIQLRKAGYSGHITFGGPFITHAYKYFLAAMPGLNSVLRGEGECSFLQLLECLKNGTDWRKINGIAYVEGHEVIANGFADIVDDISKLPIPVRDTLELLKKKGIPTHAASIYSSRGCMGRCTYCTAPVNADLISARNHKWRGKNESAIADEIEYLVSQFEVSYIYFVDENFCGYGVGFIERLSRIAEEIKRRGIKVKFHAEIRVDTKFNDDILLQLKEAGLKDVLLGLESGSNSALRRWHKGTNVQKNFDAVMTMTRLGFDVEPAMIMVDPHTTVEEFAETVEFIRNAKLYLTNSPLNMFNQLIIFPGTFIEKELAEEKIINMPDEWAVKENLEDINEIRAFCKRISSREYEVIDEKMRKLWSVLMKHIRPIAELYDEIIPNIVAMKRAKYKQDSEGGRDSQKELLKFLSALNKWKKNIGHLAIALMEKSVEWGRSENEFDLDKVLTSMIYEYDKKYLGMDIDSFIDLNMR